MSDIAKLFGGEGDDLMILTVSVPNEDMEISGSITKEDLDKPISDIFKVIFEAVEASNKLKKLGVNVAVAKKSSSPIAEFINRTNAAPAAVVNNNQEDQGERPARNPFRQNQTGVRSIVVQKGGKQVEANTGAHSPEPSDDGFEDEQQLSGENDYQELPVDDEPYSQVDEVFEDDDNEPVQQPARNAQPRRRVNSAAPAPVQPNEKLDFKRVQASMRNKSHVELAEVNAVLKIPTKIPSRIRDEMGTTTIKVRPQTNDVIKELDRRRGVDDAR